MSSPAISLNNFSVLSSMGFGAAAGPDGTTVGCVGSTYLQYFELFFVFGFVFSNQSNDNIAYNQCGGKI